MAVEAWGKVKQSTIQNCFKKCLQDQSVQVDPIEVPEGFSREAWENQIDLEDFTEQEIEDEIQVLVETRQSMDADKEVPEENECYSTHQTSCNQKTSIIQKVEKMHRKYINISYC